MKPGRKKRLVMKRRKKLGTSVMEINAAILSFDSMIVGWMQHLAIITALLQVSG